MIQYLGVGEATRKKTLQRKRIRLAWSLSFLSSLFLDICCVCAKEARGRHLSTREKPPPYLYNNKHFLGGHAIAILAVVCTVKHNNKPSPAVSSAEDKLVPVQKIKSRQERFKKPTCQHLRCTYIRCNAFRLIKITMSPGLLLECSSPEVTGTISFFRCISIPDLCSNTIINKIYSKTFCSSQRSKMHGDVLQTTHLHYHKRDFHSCFQNQNEQKQVIKNLCGETLQLIQRGKTDEIITIHKRMMHFCRNTLKPNKRTRILLDSSGKTKAVTFASLVHRSTDIPNA